MASARRSRRRRSPSTFEAAERTGLVGIAVPPWGGCEGSVKEVKARWPWGEQLGGIFRQCCAYRRGLEGRGWGQGLATERGMPRRNLAECYLQLLDSCEEGSTCQHLGVVLGVGDWLEVVRVDAESPAASVVCWLGA